MKHKLFAGAMAVLSTCAIFAFSSLAADAPKAQKPVTDGILAQHCNNRGEVDAMVIHVSQPGTYQLEWDNIKSCGVRA